jgi:hypothetical protein
MSKLEDKLTASIKPARGKTPPAANATRVAKAKPSAAKPAAPTKPPSPPAETGRDLHPRRIWPD